MLSHVGYLGHLQHHLAPQSLGWCCDGGLGGEVCGVEHLTLGADLCHREGLEHKTLLSCGG